MYVLGCVYTNIIYPFIEKQRSPRSDKLLNKKHTLGIFVDLWSSHRCAVVMEYYMGKDCVGTDDKPFDCSILSNWDGTVPCKDRVELDVITLKYSGQDVLKAYESYMK